MACASPFCSSALFASLLLVFVVPISVSHASFLEARSALPDEGSNNLVAWRRLVAETSLATHFSSDNSSLVLAAERTHRTDPLDGYKRYTGGWNISDEHYWASVAFTAVPLFLVAVAWFIVFGLTLFVISCCCCFCRRQSYSYSRAAFTISLILLLLFTCAAIVGCVILYLGQGKFHSSTITTLDYVMGQGNLTVDNLRNFSSSLAAAKSVGVDQIFLPADVQQKIDLVETKLNTSANDLATRSSDNSRKIKNGLNNIRFLLVIVAAVMLALVLLGLLFSLLGVHFVVSILVIIGWILLAVTFILCGVFLLLHNVVSDTCVAMDDWVTHPKAHTALDDILPCVDVATANESASRSREVTAQLVELVNNVIANISNKNYPPALQPLYFNQSGPLMPMLCNPYMPDLRNRTCAPGEVNFDNASQVWKSFECHTTFHSGFEICTTVGRITPSVYNQMTAAASVSQGLYQYGPFLMQLEDCTFVRETFTAISKDNCPSLEQHIQCVYIGLISVSTAVMLSLISWVVHARQHRQRKYGKQFITQPGHPHLPLQEKAP